MRGADQHHARDRLRARPQRRKRFGRHAARIDVARVRRDQRLGEDVGGLGDLPEQFRNARLQPLPLPGIEQARRRRRPDFRALRSFLHHCLDLARYPHLRI